MAPAGIVPPGPHHSCGLDGSLVELATLEQAVDPRRGDARALGRQVRVDVDRHRVVGVTEHLRDDRDLLARFEEERRERVPDVVEPDSPDAGPFLRPDERGAEGAPLHRAPVARTHDLRRASLGRPRSAPRLLGLL
jgi:hypothetical protein